jgi:hypothetical protein
MHAATGIKSMRFHSAARSYPGRFLFFFTSPAPVSRLGERAHERHGQAPSIACDTKPIVRPLPVCEAPTRAIALLQ